MYAWPCCGAALKAAPLLPWHRAMYVVRGIKQELASNRRGHLNRASLEFALRRSQLSHAKSDEHQSTGIYQARTHARTGNRCPPSALTMRRYRSNTAPLMCHSSSMQHAVNMLSANNSSLQMFTYMTYYQQHMLNRDPYAWLQTIGQATCRMQSLASRLARHGCRCMHVRVLM